jgi:hypothetical protein
MINRKSDHNHLEIKVRMSLIIMVERILLVRGHKELRQVKMMILSVKLIMRRLTRKRILRVMRIKGIGESLVRLWLKLEYLNRCK